MSGLHGIHCKLQFTILSFWMKWSFDTLFSPFESFRYKSTLEHEMKKRKFAGNLGSRCSGGWSWELLWTLYG